MTTFVIVALKQAMIQPLKEAVESKYPGNHKQAGDMCWLVADESSEVVEVAKKIGIKDKESGTLTDVLIVWAVLYWGSADPQIWAWLSEKMLQRSVK